MGDVQHQIRVLDLEPDVDINPCGEISLGESQQRILPMFEDRPQICGLSSGKTL